MISDHVIGYAMTLTLVQVPGSHGYRLYTGGHNTVSRTWRGLSGNPLNQFIDTFIDSVRKSIPSAHSDTEVYKVRLRTILCR